MPDGWSQHEGKVFGPGCTEERALKKVLRAELPSPENDPPIIQEEAEARKEIMREVVREDLGRESHLAEKLERLKALSLLQDSGAEPDFQGTLDRSAKDTTEVWVKGDFVEICWPNRSGMSLTLRHENFELVDPPPFLSPELLTWVQNGLRTMKTEERSEPNNRRPVVN
jgi:hypothetical protein